MGEIALQKELSKTKQELVLLEDQLKHSSSSADRRRISGLIKKQYYLTVLLEACLNKSTSP
ncbi:MAG: hypothetical protein HPY50_05335 [Firmicutes bacterium]|nr:hypothetical protein [Bacillota bacterium]